jgi:hypothetical protein
MVKRKPIPHHSSDHEPRRSSQRAALNQTSSDLGIPFVNTA